jgi:hypothetical protein
VPSLQPARGCSSCFDLSRHRGGSHFHNITSKTGLSYAHGSDSPRNTKNCPSTPHPAIGVATSIMFLRLNRFLMNSGFEAVYSQDAIGWLVSFLLGRLSRTWSDVQARYLESIHRRTTGRRWTIAVLEKLWDVSWDMWEHRNGIAHDPSHPRCIAQLTAKQREVHGIFEAGCHNLLPRDQRLFTKGVDKLTDGSLIEMEQWISSVLLTHTRAQHLKEDYVASLRAERASFH